MAGQIIFRQDPSGIGWCRGALKTYQSSSAKIQKDFEMGGSADCLWQPLCYPLLLIQNRNTKRSAGIACCVDSV